MNLDLSASDKRGVLISVESFIHSFGLGISAKDSARPWGGFFVIDEQQAKKFGDLFFPGVSLETLRISGKLSPKILVVQPNQRLSWQYHHRRAEIWRVVSGPVSVVTSLTDQESGSVTLEAGESIRLVQGQRHRLVGLNTWGVVAEIWQHTQESHPSDEDDIVRLQDDFGR